VSLAAFVDKTAPVGSGDDRFYARHQRGTVVDQAVVDIARRLRPDETLVVLPEGTMINYLSRRRTSLPYVNYMPTEFALYGHRNILRAFEDDPPDYILLAIKNMREYGYTTWMDYAPELWQWIDRHYPQTVAVYGPAPRGDARYRFYLRRRTESSRP
jgi:hypothetical protein